MKNLFYAFLFIFVFSSCSNDEQSTTEEDYGIEGELNPTEPLGKADSAGRLGPSISMDSASTRVWEVTNSWEDTNTTDAKQAGIAWDANSGLNWDQKYNLWVSSMKRIRSSNDYYDTFEFATPWGKTLPAPKLECAELAIFLRATFASWYHLPFYMEAVDSKGTRLYLGHFGAVTANGRYKKTPLYASWYKDYTSQFANKSSDYIVENWPRDSKLHAKHLYGGGDDQDFLEEGVGAGAYFDEIFLNKRTGHFLMLLLTYFGSAHLADSANTFNLVPDSIHPGDLLIERWQKHGIGHAMVVKSVEDLEDNKMEATIVSGSMPRRQPKWETPVTSKDYFTSDECGGEGTNWDGDEYAKLGGGIKRWRVAKKVNGRYMNTWMNGDEASWICDTDYEKIKERPTIFQNLLGEVDPQEKREALLQSIEDARNHLRNYPASCAARERREKAFEKLVELNAQHFNMTREETDTQYRLKEDYVFAQLIYSQSKTCCWNSTTPAMYQIIMEYNTHREEEAQQCLEPIVFMNNNGYNVFKEYAESIGKGALWKEWSEDEGCPQRNVATDTVDDNILMTPYCDIFDATGTEEPSSCEDDALEQNDTPNSARAIEVRNYVDLTICPNDDDWYEVELNGETAATIEFVHENGDLDFALYDSNGSEISLSDGIQNTETIDLSGLSGTYLLHVYGYNGASNQYDLSFN